MASDGRYRDGGGLARSVALVGSLTEVMPQDADRNVSRIYADMQETLRVPFVNQIFRLLAGDPDYLQAAWGYVGPIAESRAFEEAATALRDAARIDPGPAAEADWAALGDLERVRRFTESIHYVLPKLLLVVTLLDPAVRWPAGGMSDTGGTIPKGIAPDSEKIEMVDPTTAEERLRSLFEEIRVAHGHPALASYFRSLGQWPDLLAAIWARLAPFLGESGYDARRGPLIARAAELSANLATEQGPPTPSGKAAAALAVFRQRVIPDLLIDVTIVRAMLDGPAADGANRLVAP